MKNIDTKFFPGFVRKCITFSIDDGNQKYDGKFLDILSPMGFKGTFNLCSDSLSRYSLEESVKMYSGNEVASHCKYHPYVLLPSEEYEVSPDAFDIQTANEGKIYKCDIPGLYHIKKPQGWRLAADRESYKRFVRECKSELEAIFGAGSIRSFVWPFHEQNDPELVLWLKSEGYQSIRAAARNEGFSMPRDRSSFASNVQNSKILEKGREYLSLADDGELKFFCFGVHSADYERAGNWDDLSMFGAELGNRSDLFWYATLSEIFDYEDALNSIKISNGEIVNPSNIDLYIKIDGIPLVLRAKEKISV